MFRMLTSTTRPLAVALAGALAGCFTPTAEHMQGAPNIPVVASSDAGVGITVLANDFTFDQSYTGPSQGDSLAVGLVVTSYSAGTALVEIVDSSGVKQFHRSVTTNLVEAQSHSVLHVGLPASVHVRFDHFSGVFVLGVYMNGVTVAN